MSGRAAAGYFVLGILAGVVIGEAVSRATRARAEAESAAPALPRISTVPRMSGVPAGFAPYRPGGTVMPPPFRPVRPADSSAVFTEGNRPLSPAGDSGFPSVNPDVFTDRNLSVSAGHGVFHTVKTGPVRRIRRLWDRKRHAMGRGMARVVRRARHLGVLAGFAAGMAVALAVRVLGRMAELPSLPVVTWEPAPVATFGRVFDGQGVRLAVRCRPLRGGPVVPVMARPFPALTGGVVPV